MFRLLFFMMLAPVFFSSYVKHTMNYDDPGRDGRSYGMVEEGDVNRCMKEITNQKKPEVDWIAIEDEKKNGKLGSARIRDVYEVEYMPSGVVGLVGVPARVTYDQDVLEEVTLTFHYVPEELGGIPERNMIILHETDDQGYIQVGRENIDMEEKTVSVPIKESGVYLLADRYQWYSVWGVDVSDYAYTVDPLTRKSEWERGYDTGSIMEIADREWALENAPYFHVSTPQQLAGVVYYVNAINEGGESIYLSLEDDIDLAGYAWVPMGYMGPTNNCFRGVVDGQGHTISNMKIDIPYHNHCAFIAYSTGVTVKDITFENASVRGGSYTGIVGGEIYVSKKWENIHVSGTISDAYDEVGSIIGREAGTYFENCSADVVYAEADGTERPLEYFSHRLEVIDNTPVTEDFTLTLGEDGSVIRTESDKEFKNLCWHVEVDHVQVLVRGADNETAFEPMQLIPQYIPKGSKCEIWLVAFTGETYTRVSNVLEFPTE